MTPKDKQYLIYGGLALGGIILINKLSSKYDTSGGAIDPTGNGSVGSNPLPAFSAQQVANKLYNAMRNTGTNEEMIFSALAPVTVAQFSQVIAAFGAKPYNIQLGNELALPFFPNPTHTLPEWLENELSESDYTTLALRYPQL